MIGEILVSVAPGETRVACRHDGRVVELHRFLHGRPTSSGNVYLGRITRVVPGMGAAFVDIGAAKAGFLPLPGDSAMRAALHDGARVLVQVLREPERGKGAQVSTAVRLPGHLLVYTPDGEGVHISRRIGDEQVTAGLRAAIERVSLPDEGWIARTNASDASPDDFGREAAALRSLWRDIEARAKTATPPALVYAEPSPIVRVLRDKASPALRRLVVDDPQAYAAAESFLVTYRPELMNTLVRHRERVSLFEMEGIEDEFEAVGRRRVALPSGGTLAIERTEALWAIDVNTARHISGASAAATILATNLEAAVEIARQIRLRDLGGLIVVDFVHMDEEPAAQRAVLDALRGALAGDPSPVRVAGFSDLGLVELSRRRARPALDEEFFGTCPTCDGSGLVHVPLVTALAAFREAARSAADGSGPIRIALPPTAVAVLQTAEAAAGRDELARRSGRTIEITADSTLGHDRFKVDAQ